jgi:hypothetical protein
MEDLTVCSVPGGAVRLDDHEVRGGDGESNAATMVRLVTRVTKES